MQTQLTEEMRQNARALEADSILRAVFTADLYRNLPNLSASGR